MNRRLHVVTLGLALAMASEPAAQAAARERSNGFLGIGAVIRNVARARAQSTGKRVFHATRAGYSATLEPTRQLQRILRNWEGVLPVEMHFSRGDNSADGSGSTVLGIALRMPAVSGAEDLKFITARKGMLRRIPTSANSYFTGPLSTVLASKVNARNHALYLEPARVRSSVGTTGRVFDEVERLASAGAAKFRLMLRPTGPFQQSVDLGVITLDKKLSADRTEGIEIFPWTNKAFVPTGLLNDASFFAYEGSQEGRRLARQGK